MQETKENLSSLETYDYSLPKELIAQYPSKKRDESRLLCFKGNNKDISHHTFKDIPDLLNKNDILVLNDTKVIPARFFVKTESDKEVEIVLVNSISKDNLTWNIIAGPQKHLRKTDFITLIHKDSIKIKVLDDKTIGFKSSEDLRYILEEAGQLPLPPYVKRTPDKEDTDRYQTVFAKKDGAIAAPTAALHFTEEVLEKIKAKGVEILYITLHVGPGTFMPVKTENIKDHNLMAERFEVEKETWEKISEGKKNGKRIIACGTTVIRTLEFIFSSSKLEGLNDLYITPDYKFKMVDAIITNFHLPKTSLLILISSFLGWDNVKYLYEEAIKEKYRFYSYGDATFLE